ncbi:MAG: type III-A CRISPR-associated RAMP protein Csm4 [Bacteroidetes bacterium]|nr:type III-A CRISPR-associated RAMP protein Csm4 [Bacteroidota bacterium]
MIAVYLTPHSGFITPLRSDTLWGLLLVGIRTLYSEEKVNSIITSIEKREPPFLISSAFPFYNNKKEKEHFLPKPFLAMKNTSFDRVLNDNDRKDAAILMNKYKQYKKLTYVSRRVFEQFINGRLSEAEYVSQFSQEQPAEQAVVTSDILHAPIDRLSGTTAGDEQGKGLLFYTHEYTIKKGGMYFLVNGERSLLEPVLRFLQHFGFGGDNSVGKGIFNVEMEDFSLSFPAQPTHFVTLSLYSPRREELEAFKRSGLYLSYDVEMRSGRLGTHFLNTGENRKKALAQFTEGSVFPALDAKCIGTVHAVHTRGDFQVRQNGLAFPVPMMIKENA